MNEYCLMLGGNIGPTRSYFEKAKTFLSDQCGKIISQSAIYQSEPWGLEIQAAFLNQALLIQSPLEPLELLQKVKAAEIQIGRRPSLPNGPRIIDIDILYSKDRIFSEPGLEIPHPRMHLRNFNLIPVLEIDPDWVHPVLEKTIKELVAQSPDTLKVHKADPPRYIVIEGNIGAGKTSLARMLAKDFNAEEVLEEFAENTFLTQFYQDQSKYAFPLELSFLAARHQQLKQVFDNQLTKTVVSDYHLQKSRLFAQITLDPAEFSLYNRFFDIISPQVPEPDLVIYLRKEVPRLMSNIRHRGREYEQNISEDYIASLNKAYDNLVAEYPFRRLLKFDSGEMDFINNRHDYATIINAINH